MTIHKHHVRFRNGNGEIDHFDLDLKHRANDNTLVDLVLPRSELVPKYAPKLRLKTGLILFFAFSALSFLVALCVLLLISPTAKKLSEFTFSGTNPKVGAIVGLVILSIPTAILVLSIFILLCSRIVRNLRSVSADVANDLSFDEAPSDRFFVGSSHLLG